MTRHASGETDGRCDACVIAGWFGEDETEPCTRAIPDPELPGVCGTCGHTIEEVPA